MGKVKSRSRGTRCTCTTNLDRRTNNKNQHRPTGVEALSKSCSRLKSVVVSVEKQVKFKRRDLPTGVEANATGHTRLKFPVISHHHAVRSRAKGHKRSRVEIEIEIKSPIRPTKVKLQFENSVEIRLKSKAGTFTLRV